MNHNKCPVVTLSIHDNDGIIYRSENFYEYMIAQFRQRIDNLDDDFDIN